MTILAIVFLAAFATVILVGYAFSLPASREKEVTAIRLAALSAPQSRAARETMLTVRREERLSTLPWLDELLGKIDFSERLRLLLYQADSSWTVGRLLLIATFAALLSGGLVHLRTGASVLSMIIGFGAATIPFVYALRLREKRFDQMRQFLPEALDMMVAAIRAGHSFASAMGMAAKESPEPIRREFRQCFEEQNYGLELRAALANLQYRVPIREIGMIVTAIVIQSESGGNLNEILEKAAYLIRENFKLRRQVRIHTAQGRISGWILAAFPFILGFLLYLINPVQMSLLWTHPTGRKVMYTALTMTAIGALVIRKIVRVRI